MATAGKRDIELVSVAAYKDNELVGYVSKTQGVGACLVTNIVTSWKPKFATKKGTSVCRLAQTAAVCNVEGGKKFYPKQDDIEFRCVSYY